MDPDPPHSTTPHTQQHPQHTDPPQARVSMSGGAPRVPDPVPPSLETQVLLAEPESAPAPRRRRSSTILVPVLGLLALALIGLSTWWYMSRQGGGAGVDDPPFTTPEARPTSVPVNAVALINSSTPIPLVAPRTAGNSTVDLASEPDSTGWSQALREAHRAREEGRYSSAISQYSALVGAGA
jgi:hypothetical protein